MFFVSVTAVVGKTGQFLRLIIYTSMTFVTLQCFMQIPFSYIPAHGKTKTLCYGFGKT